MYRRALRQVVHWNSPDRDGINSQAAEIRAKFDANMNVSER